ncbi:MAG: hypothetical protein ACUVTP_07845 [Candidatus Fervidibacter sp.]|uniref:hypothetical protein n=1 Tax=Candidatus Fervidibacter sp. TaxID=3100871 RepID=UPI00404BA1C6
MNGKTLEVNLPAGLADALTRTLEKILDEAGFGRKMKAGEVGGIETRIWQKENAEVVITVHESDVEETVSVSVRGIDGAALLKAVAARLALELFESLPLEAKQDFQPIMPELRRLSKCPSEK